MMQNTIASAPVPYDPARGQCFQGDVVLVPVPAGIAVSRAQPFKVDAIGKAIGDVVLAAGEATGHNHAFRYGLEGVARFHDGALARTLDQAAAPAVGTAAMYRDHAALREMVRKGVLTTDSLCVGFLVVEGTCPPLTHDEHAPIAVPPGTYYVGAKREQDAASERRVID